MSILDLCCGDGGSTYELLRALDTSRVAVQKIVGYDISREQITRASEHALKDLRLSFRVQDVEKMEDFNQYDIIISLFGLHWMENLEKVAEKIHNAIKPSGKLIFFVPLEKMDLFQLRLKLMYSKEWQGFFENYKLLPFVIDENVYIQAFDKYFLNTEIQRGAERKEFSEQAFITFLSSWMQEVRHLSDKNKRQEYVRDLVSSIPENTYPNVKRLKKDRSHHVVFNEQFLFYKGSSRPKITKDYDRDKQEKAILWRYQTVEPVPVKPAETPLELPLRSRL